MAEVLGAAAGVPVLFPEGLNVSIYLDVNRFARQSAWAHGFMHDYALWLGLVLLAVTFLGAYAVVWWQRRARAVALLGLSGAGTVAALGLNQLVGHAARELRPYDTLHHVLVLVAREHDYAFPSDHAVVAGGLVSSIVLCLWRSRAGAISGDGGTAASRGARGLGTLAAVATVLGLFLCFARVYVGAHYPGDVVAGFLLGSVVVLAASLLRPVAELLAGLALQTPLSVLVRRPWPSQRPEGDGCVAGHRAGEESAWPPSRQASG